MTMVSKVLAVPMFIIAVAYLTVPGGVERTLAQPFQVGPEFP